MAGEVHEVEEDDGGFCEALHQIYRDAVSGRAEADHERIGATSGDGAGAPR
jgi:hypothetical protein